MASRILEQLLGEIPVPQFLSEYYLRLPFALRGGCHFARGLADSTVLDRLLQMDNTDIIVGRGGSQYGGSTPRSLAEAASVLDQGYTIGIRGAQRYDTAIAALAAGFAKEFAAPVDIHLYCTPSEQPGFGWHYDAEEVFVLQMVGDKEWHLRKNTVNPLPLMETIPADQHYER